MLRNLFCLALTALLAIGSTDGFAGDYDWEFKNTNSMEGWKWEGVINNGVSNGVVQLIATRGNLHIFTPKVEIDAGNQGFVTFRMRLGKGLQAKGCLLFVTEEQPQWDDRTVVLFDCHSDGEFHDYEVDMSKNSFWKGKVTQLRFQPFSAQWPLPEEQCAIDLESFRVPDVRKTNPTGTSNTTELIPNGSFEQIEANGYPAGWKKFCEDPLTIDVGSMKISGNPANSMVAGEAHSGKHATVVQIKGPKNEIGGWATRIKFMPRTMYRLTFWARVKGASAGVTVNEFKTDGITRTIQHCVLVDSEDWKSYSFEFESHPDTVGAQIAVYIWESTGQAWFDDISLQKMDFSKAVAGPEIKPTPLTHLTREIVTPHISWANPLATGPVKLFAIPTDREVVELAQRLSLDFTTWNKFTNTEKGNEVLDQIYYNPGKRSTFLSFQELKAKLTDRFEVILIGVLDWASYPDVIKKDILEKVKNGAGLVFIRPTRETKLEPFMEQPLEVPTFLTCGVPFEGLTVLAEDVKGKEWLKCYTCGKGRVAIVDYQHEFFSIWDAERYFRRGEYCPFTPDVTYDYRAKPLYYDYYQSLLAKLVLWAAQREGPVNLCRLVVEKGGLQAMIRNSGPANPGVKAELVVRDPDGNVESTREETVDLCAGETNFYCALQPFKSGPHFADLWLKQDGKTLAWGSACFQSASPREIAAIRTSKFSYGPDETVEGSVSFNKALDRSLKVRIQFADSLGRLLAEKVEVVPEGGQDIAFRFSLAGAVAILHSVKASLSDDQDNILSEKSADILCRRIPKSSDDFKFWFWSLGCGGNNLPARQMLKDLYARGFDVAYSSYLYAQPPDQLKGLLRSSIGENLDLALYAFSLACWNSGSDATATISPRCLTAKPFRENMFNVLRQHASVGRDYPVHAYSLGDETGITGYSQDFCFSPTCMDFTRNYLKSTYGDLEKLNAEWGTRFESWDQVKCMTLAEAQKGGNLAPWTDLRMAMEAMYAALIKESGQVIRAADPEARVGVEGIHGGTMPVCGENSYGGYDFGKIIPQGNYWGCYFQFYPQIEFIRSFTTSNTIIQTFTQPFEDHPKGYYEDKWQNEKINRYVPWYDLLHGMNSIQYWDAMDTKWYGFYARDLRPTPWAEQITETMQEIKRGAGMLLVRSQRTQDGIAIHYSPSSFHMGTALGGKERIYAPQSFCRLLEDLGLQYDFVSKEQMEQGALNKYKVIILPYSRAIDEKEAAALRQFAAKGGTIIADGDAGIMDGHGRRVKENMLAGINVQTTLNPIWKYLKIRDSRDGNSYRAEIKSLLEKAGVQPQFRIAFDDGSEPVGCELAHFVDGQAEYLGILQGREYLRKETEDHTPRPATIMLPRKYRVYSVRDGDYLGFTDKITTAIEPAVAQLYALLPAKVAKVQIAGLQKSYYCGEEVRCQVRAKVRPDVATPHVFHLEVRTPQGRIHREYTRNIYAPPNEAGEVCFRFALNDQPGKWRIRVTDAASGRKIDQTIVVKKAQSTVIAKQVE